MIASFNLTKPQFATAPPPPVTWATLEISPAEIAAPPPPGRTSATRTPRRRAMPPGCGPSVSERPSRSKPRLAVALAMTGAFRWRLLNGWVSWNRGTPSYHPFLEYSRFSTTKQPFWIPPLMETLKDLHMMFIPEKIMIGDPPPHAGLCFCDWGLDILKVPSNKIRKKMERSGTYQLVCVAKDVKISSVSSKPTNGRIKQQIN